MTVGDGVSSKAHSHTLTHGRAERKKKNLGKQRKSDRRGCVAIFKQTYKSSPTLQVLRIISAQEEMFHNGKGRGAARQKQTGRFKKVKIETDSTASYETDPFKSLTSFLSNANAQAGAGGD